MNASSERGLWLPEAAGRANLAAFVERARRLDEAAVIRLRQRSEEVLVAWAPTGFDVLTSRVVAGAVKPPDLCAGADELLRGLRTPGTSRYVHTGFPMDSAWRWALPPDSGYAHLDDVPVSVVAELAQRGAELSSKQGAQGPPVSLLEQEVIHVSSAGMTVGIPMRCVFAVTAMRFGGSPDGVVRVRTVGPWLRIDAVYGSVYYHRQLLRVV